MADFGVAHQASYPPEPIPVWRIVDKRTGQVASVGVYLSEDSALRAIARWKSRAARGGRPDISADTLANLVTARLLPSGEGTAPGELP